MQIGEQIVDVDVPVPMMPEVANEIAQIGDVLVPMPQEGTQHRTVETIVDAPVPMTQEVLAPTPKVIPKERASVPRECIRQEMVPIPRITPQSLFEHDSKITSALDGIDFQAYLGDKRKMKLLCERVEKVAFEMLDSGHPQAPAALQVWMELLKTGRS